ncbi:MAG: ATP-binding cassette domain-containing protein, partial [Chloroflexi bacterium]|nr:ATP-binding cassette domain-containing protein [Chloroflexota bacterium]
MTTAQTVGGPAAAQDRDLVVDVQGVSRKFVVGGEDIWAVRDVSLQVAQGEFVALIGRSGSGKTTLLNLIAGLDSPTSGHVTIDGENITEYSERQLTQLRRHRVGFVFQSFGLLPLLSAYENVELSLRIAGAGIRERRRRAEELLEAVGLGGRARHRPYELSGGEQQRVAIARALA